MVHSKDHKKFVVIPIEWSQTNHLQLDWKIRTQTPKKCPLCIKWAS